MHGCDCVLGAARERVSLRDGCRKHVAKTRSGSALIFRWSGLTSVATRFMDACAVAQVLMMPRRARNAAPYHRGQRQKLEPDHILFNVGHLMEEVRSSLRACLKIVRGAVHNSRRLVEFAAMPFSPAPKTVPIFAWRLNSDPHRPRRRARRARKGHRRAIGFWSNPADGVSPIGPDRAQISACLPLTYGSRSRARIPYFPRLRAVHISNKCSFSLRFRIRVTFCVLRFSNWSRMSLHSSFALACICS